MPESRTDAALAAAARGGDRAAFSEVVKRHQGTVYRLALRILGDPGDANDAAQEAFLKAYRNLSSYDPGRPFAPWLFRIARNHSLDVRRKKTGSPEQLERADPDDPDDAPGAVGRNTPDEASPDALSLLQGAELRARIGDALARLDPKYREVVELYHYEGLTYDEIAQTLAIPIGTVMTRIHRGRGRLADALKTLRAA